MTTTEKADAVLAAAAVAQAEGDTELAASFARAADDVRNGSDRVVVGKPPEPQEWLMSTVNDPTNWDYAPDVRNSADDSPRRILLPAGYLAHDTSPEDQAVRAKKIGELAAWCFTEIHTGVMRSTGELAQEWIKLPPERRGPYLNLARGLLDANPGVAFNVKRTPPGMPELPPGHEYT